MGRETRVFTGYILIGTSILSISVPIIVDIGLSFRFLVANADVFSVM